VAPGEAGVRQDFLQLSRKHAIDVDAHRAHISIFGGKLTDCLNVGEEICDIAAGLGLPLSRPRRTWYGEPVASARADFMQRAHALNLDARTPVESDEALSTRLWRRYGRQAFDVLKAIEQDAAQAEPILAGTAFIRAEIELMAAREMIVTLEDFLRRRSDLALVARRDELRQAAGLMDVCALLFGADQAAQQFNDYFDSKPASRALARELSESRGHEPQA
jgi:glycerol-3-phosphate dehydrogenase